MDIEKHSEKQSQQKFDAAELVFFFAAELFKTKKESEKNVYMPPEAFHRERGWSRTLISRDQTQGKCMHYLPEIKSKNVIIIINWIFIISIRK